MNTNLVEKNVVIANTLVRSAQGLSLAEKRILFAAIAKMGGKFGEVRISAAEYASAFGIDINTAYEQLKKAGEQFFNRYFTLAIPDKKGVWKKKIRWLQDYGYHDGMGETSLSFTSKVLPYLIDLEREFTKYKLKQACALRSVHSWRLLELFTQQSSGWLLISVNDLSKSMDLSQSYTKNFKDLRTKIIEPAIKELTNKDGWLIRWEPIKTGRKVTQLKFEFKKDPQQKFKFKE